MLKKFILIFLILIPIIGYAFLVFYFSVDIPGFDDYAFLEHMNISDDSLRYQHLFAQHNEHRIAWNRLVAEFCYFAFGKISFKYLAYIGNLGLLFCFLLLFKISEKQKIYVMLFIPVSYLIFQPQAWENATWAMGSLQNYYVLFFALLVLYFWNKKIFYGYIAAWVFGLMAIYTSANGLLIFLVLIIWQLTEFIEKFKIYFVYRQTEILINKRPSLLLIISFLLTIFIYFIYLIGYQKPPHHPSMIAAIFQPMLLVEYTGTLLGSCIGKTFSFWIGLLEIIIFLWLTYKRYDQRNPVIYYFIIFIILSVFITALGRSGFGIEQALSSRYKTLSVLALALTYLALVESYPKPFSNRLAIFFLILMATVFNIYSTIISIQYLSSRKDMLIVGMATWQHSRQGLAFPSQEYASLLLDQSVKKGIYYPPGWRSNTP